METTKVGIPSSGSSTVYESKTLPLATIKVDSGLQVRAHLSEETIATYAKEMEEGAEFPPVDVFYDGAVYWLANGFHRYSATKKVERSEISVRLHQGQKRDAMLFAINADINLGLRRSNEDKNRAVKLLLNDEEWKLWSDKTIAGFAGVSDRFVAKLKNELSPNGSQMTSVKYTKNGVDRVMTLPQKNRSEPSESELTANSRNDNSSSSDGLRSQGIDAPTVVDKPVVRVKEDMAKVMSHRKMSRLEVLAVDFSDTLDAMLTRGATPDEKAIVAVGDVDVLVRRFLEKFSKDEV